VGAAGSGATVEDSGAKTRVDALVKSCVGAPVPSGRRSESGEDPTEPSSRPGEAGSDTAINPGTRVGVGIKCSMCGLKVYLVECMKKDEER
jgi:hypothetical protein